MNQKNLRLTLTHKSDIFTYQLKQRNTMKKAKYKIGDKLYWYSVIEGRVIGGIVKKIEGDEYRISVDGNMWGV